MSGNTTQSHSAVILCADGKRARAFLPKVPRGVLRCYAMHKTRSAVLHWQCLTVRDDKGIIKSTIIKYVIWG